MAVDRKNLFTKTTERLVLKYLELYYAHLLKKWIFFREHPPKYLPITTIEANDREHRAKLKACEILLFNLKSPLMANVEKPSFKSTKDIAGGAKVISLRQPA